MNFNEKLIELRKSKGLSQDELGQRLGVSRQTISKWELAQSYPDFQRLVLISDYFGLSLDALEKMLMLRMFVIKASLKNRLMRSMMISKKSNGLYTATMDAMPSTAPSTSQRPSSAIQPSTSVWWVHYAPQALALCTQTCTWRLSRSIF